LGITALGRQLAPAHPDVRFALAGAGTEPDRAALAAAIPAHDLAGWVLSLGERSDLECLDPAFDIVTLSSAVGEAFPMVLGEAMACGIPASRPISGIRRSSHHRRYWNHRAPRDRHALAAGWQRVIALGHKGRRALGIKARAGIVESYDIG
jgi:glycosyltransferase involved in cell wall biosynthesis